MAQTVSTHSLSVRSVPSLSWPSPAKKARIWRTNRVWACSEDWARQPPQPYVHTTLRPLVSRFAYPVGVLSSARGLDSVPVRTS